MLVLLTSPALAQVLVQSSGVSYPTLGEAISAAAAGDTLSVSPGTYVESVSVDRDLTITGAPGVTLDGSGGAVAVLEVQAGVQLVVTGVRIVSESCRGIDLPSANTLVLEDVELATTSPAEGGGIRAVDPIALTLTDVLFDGTSAALDGGGLHVSSSGPSSVALTDVSFVGSRANGYGYGGAIFASGGAVTCVRCRFDGNLAWGSGGATIVAPGTLTITDSEFRGNHAFAAAGALAVDGQGAAAEVSRTTFCGNTSDGYGGAAISDGELTLRNSAFIGNDSLLSGAVWVALGSATITNVTFVGNGGQSAIYADESAMVQVVNTAIVDATGSALLVQAPATATFDHGLVWGNAGNDFAGVTPTNLVEADPAFVAFSDDGDCDNDLLWPLPNSPLVDAGDPSILDLDGSVSDIGVSGGPDAAPLDDDADGDGVPAAFDCDDGDAGVWPTAEERCDGRDDDCDGEVDDDAVDRSTWYEDCDGDGQGVLASETRACAPPDSGCGWITDGDRFDCDDADPAVFVGAVETCADGDQNCDLDPDLGAADTTPWYLDLDGDGYGLVETRVDACAAPADHVEREGDCDDRRPDAFAGAPEVVGDGLDQDCDGIDNTVTPAGACSVGGAPASAGVLLPLLVLVRHRRIAAPRPARYAGACARTCRSW